MKLKESTLVPVKEVIRNSMKAIEAFAEPSARRITVLPAGFKEYDRLVGELKPSELRIVTGNELDKTAICANLAIHATVEAGLPVAIFSSGRKEEICLAMLCSMASIERSKVIEGRIAESDWPELTKAAGILSEAHIFFDDASNLVTDKAAYLNIAEGLGLLIVDHSLKGWGEEMSALEELAGNMNVPIVVLA